MYVVDGEVARHACGGVEARLQIRPTQSTEALYLRRLTSSLAKHCA